TAEPEPDPEPDSTADPEPDSTPDPEPDREPEPEVSRSREVTVGEEVRLSLGNGGWVYLGEESGEDGLSFRRRYSEDGETVFVFSVDEPGEYVVRFQRQDLDRGIFREERVALEARSDSGTAPETASGAASESTSERASESPADDQQDEAPAADLDEAYALLDEGRREAALEAFLQSYPVGDPEVHGLIARLAFDLGRWETARSHWDRNLDAGEPFARDARLGLFRTALETEDAEPAWEHYRELAGGETDAGAPDIPGEELLRLGSLLLESGDPSRAVEPLEVYMEAGGTPEDPAALYYRLGQLHEERRDARGAMEYYRRVVEDYPLSRHWQAAQERVQYLRRHFFDIR
ncbi:MAG: tetratricopeptide repeat protein, partial [Spirochaetota bacterium]